MDLPPDGVMNLLDIFYPSRLQQLLLMDMVNFLTVPVLESLLAWNAPEDSGMGSPDICGPEDDLDIEVDTDAVLFRTEQVRTYFYLFFPFLVIICWLFIFIDIIVHTLF
jgi:hypothetical protein